MDPPHPLHSSCRPILTKRRLSLSPTCDFSQLQRLISKNASAFHAPQRHGLHKRLCLSCHPSAPRHFCSHSRPDRQIHITLYIQQRGLATLAARSPCAIAAPVQHLARSLSLVTLHGVVAALRMWVHVDGGAGRGGSSAAAARSWRNGSGGRSEDIRLAQRAPVVVGPVEPLVDALHSSAPTCQGVRKPRPSFSQSAA